MLDAVSQVAFAVQSNPGVYALLLGSGVSRGAKIPTGWEVVGDLIRRAAAAAGLNSGSDPHNWYFEQYGKEPDYSQLLADLGKTPAERTGILRSYFEPTDEERSRGEKTPTAAHKAIADLVRKGYIKVILTTNFDRLLEAALADIGPTVISTADQLQGAIPLPHSRCTVIKLHGDYLDTRIRNTLSELSEYDWNTNQLLDRILDEYGLVVSGWSAEWDVALRAAIERAPNRRYSAFWTATSAGLSEAAQRLVDHRRATVVTITTADEFFGKVAERIATIESINEPHPLSPTLASAEVKRLMSRSGGRISLEEMITGEAERVYGSFARLDCSATPTVEQYAGRLRLYESGASILLSMLLPLVIYEGDESLIRRSVERLADIGSQPRNGNSSWLDLRYFPAMWISYAVATTGCWRKNYRAVAAVFVDTLAQPYGERQQRLLKFISPMKVIVGAESLPELKGVPIPASEYVFARLRAPLREYIKREEEYERAFDVAEFLMAIEHGVLREKSPSPFWVPLGRFGKRAILHDNTELDSWLHTELTKKKGGWEVITAGFANGDYNLFEALRIEIWQLNSKVNWYQ